MTTPELPYNAKALFDYKAVEDTELSVNKNDFMIVEEINDTGWCLAKALDGRAGWLPVDYVEKTDEPIPVTTGTGAGTSEASTPTPTPPTTTTTTSSSSSSPPSKSTVDDDVQNALKSLSAVSADPESFGGGSGGGSSGTGASAVVEIGSSSSSGGSGDGKTCHACRKPIPGAFVVAKEFSFHPECFACATCKTSLGGKPFIEKDDKFYCEDDYYASFNPKCGSCDEVIKGQYISALGKSWHPEHFVCTTCKAPFEGSQFRKHEDMPYCEEHFNLLFATPCAKCGLNIVGQVFQALDKKYHLDCFVCAKGDHKIGESGNFHMHEGKIYCPAHFDELVLNRCSGCKQLIRGQYIKIMDQFYHPEHWQCADCKVTLKADTCAQLKNVFYCKPCHAKKRAEPSTSTSPSPSTSPAPKVEDSQASKEAEQKAKDALAKLAAEREAKARAEILAQKQADEAKAKLEEEKKKGTYTFFDVEYGVLVAGNPPGVDPGRKEMYLSDIQFRDKFKMDKAAFAKLPKWRQDNLKRDVKLF